MRLIRNHEKLAMADINKQSYKKFFNKLLKDKPQIAKIILVMIFVSGLYVSVPFVLKAAVQKLYFIQDLHYILAIAVTLIIAAIILGIIKEKLITTFSIDFVAKIKKELYLNILSKSLNKFSKIGVGKFLATLSYNVSLIKSAISEWGIVAAQQIINFIALFTASFFVDSRLSLLFFSMIPIFVIYVVIIQYIVRKYALELMTLNKDIFDNAYKNLSDFKGLKVSVREEQAMKTFNRLVDRDADIRVQRTLIYQYNKIILHGISLLLVIAFIIIGGRYLNQQEMTFEEFVFFVLYIHLLFRPFEITLFMSSFFEAGKIGIKTVFPLLKGANLQKIKNTHLKGEIKIIDASYKHPSSNFRLAKINLKIHAGDIVTIIGDNNAGKSSFVQMLLQLVKLRRGEILFDGKKVKNIGLRTVRKNIAVVSEDYLLSNTTIFNFFASGQKQKMKHFDAGLIQLCQELNLNGKIISLGSRKYQSRIYVDDMRFSETEKLKLALVKAVYLNSKIIILDNFWHNFDLQTLKQVKTFLAKHCKNKTIIQLSSHKENTIFESNKVFNLKEGKLTTA